MHHHAAAAGLAVVVTTASSSSTRAVLSAKLASLKTAKARLVAMAHEQPRRQLSTTFETPDKFRLKKALVLSKISRLEFERTKHHDLDDDRLKDVLARRGSDFASMKAHYEIHRRSEERLVAALESHGVETRVCKRGAYTDDAIRWADAIFTAGGDGTFLMAASKLLNTAKPIVGINSDPTRSEGYLCLPKRYSDSVELAVDKIMRGSFHWFLRKRLRITLVGDRDQVMEPPIELHRQELQYPEYRFVDLVTEQTDHPLGDCGGNGGDGNGSSGQLARRVLPILALNEVFVGESLSSRVSYLEMKMNGEMVYTKTRNSGLCVSTGTGSTSWTFNINKLTHQSVETLLRIVNESTELPLDWKNDVLVEAVTQRFNNEIVFDPEHNLMAYTIRDPVSVGTFPSGSGAMRDRRPRGKATRMEVKSRCFDACLVIDGSLSFKFNDGTRAIIEIHDEDALRTVKIKEDDDNS